MKIKQIGSILVITLVFLLFLQIVAVSVISSNHISHHVVSNYVLRSTLEKTANKVIGKFLKNKDYFLNYAAYLDSSDQFRPGIETNSADISAQVVDFYCFNNVTQKKSYTCNLNNQIWYLEVIISSKKNTVSISINQGLKLISKTGSEASTALSDISIKRLWWYRN